MTVANFPIGTKVMEFQGLSGPLVSHRKLSPVDDTKSDGGHRQNTKPRHIVDG
jgi:hypothetical protein